MENGTDEKKINFIISAPNEQIGHMIINEYSEQHLQIREHRIE